MVAPVVPEMDEYAKICPTNVEYVPKVAELGTTQKTLQNLAPLMSLTTLFDAVYKIEMRGLENGKLHSRHL